MDTVYASFNPEIAVGVDYMCSDADDKTPIIYELTSKDAHSWFTKHPSGDCPAIRLLTVSPSNQSSDSSLPWTEPTVEHALWNREVYTNLASTTAGGVAALVDNPYRFILQTPIDDGPFCSFALSKRGIAVKGIYIYSTTSFDGEHDDVFEPSALLEGEIIMPGWRSTGLQIINLPSAFLRQHSSWMERQLARIIERIGNVETALFDARHPPDLPNLNHALHTCSTRLVVLERRSKLEKHTIDAIETVCQDSRQGSVPWPALAPLKNAVNGRDFEFESLPRRIMNARATINTLINQRSQAMNLEIAESSQRIAEATLSDAASMKTIAVLTMLFLPGTAVASFFSMTMFNWAASDGSQIASVWLWVYFVIAVPLTAGVLIAWYIWAKRAERRARARHGLAMTDAPEDVAEQGFSDRETAAVDPGQQVHILSGDDVEMQVFESKGSKDDA